MKYAKWKDLTNKTNSKQKKWIMKRVNRQMLAFQKCNSEIQCILVDLYTRITRGSLHLQFLHIIMKSSSRMHNAHTSNDIFLQNVSFHITNNH